MLNFHRNLMNSVFDFYFDNYKKQRVHLFFRNYLSFKVFLLQTFFPLIIKLFVRNFTYFSSNILQLGEKESEKQFLTIFFEH